MALAPSTRARIHAAIGCGGAFWVWWHFQSPFSVVLLAITSGFLVLALAAPRAYRPIQHTFDLFTRVLLAAITWLTLGFVYYAVFTPVRFACMLFGADPLKQRPLSGGDTYLQPMSAASRFDRQF